MPRHSFIQMTKLPDVRGRVDYISNPKRQEHLYATYSTVNPEFWKYLSEQAQYDFRKSNQKNGKCIEARELVIALPEKLQTADPDLVLKLFTETFRTKYDVQCTAALHHNKAKTNYHIHLIFADRIPLEETEIKYAPRNMFYDENGRHVRTKKEIMDENKQIRPGCRIIPKGSIYEIRFFSERKDLFKEKSFLQEVKIMYTDLINQCLQDEKDKLQVFDKSGPYLPTKKVGKNNPKAKEIEADNEMRREWNQAVDQVLIAGGTQKEVVEFKQKYVTNQVAHSIEVNGQDPEVFVYILYQAIDIVKQFLHFLMVMGSKREERIKPNETGPHREQLEVEEKISFDPLELQKAQAEYLKMKSHHDALSSINKKIYAINKTVETLNKQLKAIPKNIFHRKERRIIEKKIASEKEKLKKAKETLEIYPMQHLYDSVNSIEQAYRDAEEKYGALLEKEEQYKDSLRTQKNTKRTTDNLSKEKESPSMPDHARTGHTIAGNKPARQKKSVLMRLAEKQESMKNTNRQRENIPSRSNRRKGGPEL